MLKVKDASLVVQVLLSPSKSGPLKARQDYFLAFGEQIIEQSISVRVCVNLKGPAFIRATITIV